jgi:hypothetical protein
VLAPRSFANPGEMSYATIEGAYQQAPAHLDLYRRWTDSCPPIDLVSRSYELEATSSARGLTRLTQLRTLCLLPPRGA